MQNKSQINVLVVDDSFFLRRNLPRIMERDPEIRVVGTAENGRQAIEKAKQLKPDVITLDVVMPIMDGLTALKHIMREIPTPVVMISSTTHEGSRQTMEALTSGAIDYISKPSGAVSPDFGSIQSELITKIKSAAKVDVKSSKFGQTISNLSERPKSISMPKGFDKANKTAIELVAIATSTGGPAALQIVLKNLPKDIPVGIVIVQHIATSFCQALADRLNDISPLEVKICVDFEWVRPGLVLIVPAGQHMRVRYVAGKVYAMPDPEPSDTLHRPSADILFNSIADKCAAKTCAVIMTGMGYDGASGIKKIKDNGGVTIAQDEASSIIFGMPKVAIEKGAIDIVAPLKNISREIIKAVCA